MAELQHDRVSKEHVLYEAWIGRIRGSLKCVFIVPSPACVNQPVYMKMKRDIKDLMSFFPFAELMSMSHNAWLCGLKFAHKLEVWTGVSIQQHMAQF